MIAQGDRDNRGAGGPKGGSWRPRAVALSPRAARELAKLPAQVQKQVGRALERFATTGYGDLTKLTDWKPPAYRLRVGDWRVLFAMTPERIEVERIVNRREAY